MDAIRGLRALVLALATAAALALPAVANANPGDLLADVNALGTGIASDGHSLYYTDTAGLFLHAISPAGTQGPDIALTGTTGIQALTYDSPRDRFWGVDGTGLGVYSIDKTGLALVSFVINPATDLPGACGSLSCSTRIDGLAYDTTDDSLWYLPSGSTRIYHIDTAGNPLGYLDVSALGCGTATGVAAGADSLYVTACGRVIRATKTNTGASSVLSSFAAPAPAPLDVECDDVTFAPDVVWVRHSDGHLRAVEIALGTCVFGGGVRLDPSQRWMSGGGSFEAVQPQSIENPSVIAHEGLHLQCDSTTPNTLQVTWDKGNSFHLDPKQTLTNVCGGDPTVSPTSGFNALRGEGYGRLRYDGQTMTGYAVWDFHDNGEPGALRAGGTDMQSVFIYKNAPPDMGGIAVLEPCSCPIQGNLQAHDQGGS